MSRLKYALIGHGRRGSVHLLTTALKDTFEIVAVCDAHSEQRKNITRIRILIIVKC